jgi:hypothetical protein
MVVNFVEIRQILTKLAHFEPVIDKKDCPKGHFVLLKDYFISTTPMS